MIGAAFTSLVMGAAFEFAAIVGVATSRTNDEVEATAKFHALGKAFLLMGIVLIVVAIIGGEG